MERIIREGYRFRQDICIPCYQTDSNSLLQPAAFLDMAQEMAYWGAAALGFGYEDLHVHGTAWVLSRMHVRFGKHPVWRDNVSLYTWHKGMDGIFALRDFRMDDSGGNPIVTATSSWLVINVSTRRIVRAEELEERLKTDGPVPDAIPDRAPKIIVPRDVPAEEVATRRVSYSDIDVNGHTNNARYIVWAMDAIPYEVTSKRPVKDLCVNFNRETLPEDEILLVRFPVGDGFIIEGRLEDKSAFTVKVTF